MHNVSPVLFSQRLIIASVFHSLVLSVCFFFFFFPFWLCFCDIFHLVSTLWQRPDEGNSWKILAHNLNRDEKKRNITQFEQYPPLLEQPRLYLASSSFVNIWQKFVVFFCFFFLKLQKFSEETLSHVQSIVSPVACFWIVQEATETLDEGNRQWGEK